MQLLGQESDVMNTTPAYTTSQNVVVSFLHYEGSGNITISPCSLLNPTRGVWDIHVNMQAVYDDLTRDREKNLARFDISDICYIDGSLRVFN